MNADRPHLPIDELRSALGDAPEAHSTLDALDQELRAERPDATRITEHVSELRDHAPLRTLIANWFDDPRTQAFIEELNALGL